jgi:xanthine dehydrogenase YagT iron-sulfur-binding subunit
MAAHEEQVDKVNDSSGEITRREFVRTSVVLSGAIGLGISGLSKTLDRSVTSASVTSITSLSLTMNGERREVSIDSRTSLLDLLREHFGLSGTKKGCDRGQCGACTVLVNSRRIVSCLSLAIVHDGDEITTIEGLGSAGRLHPVQIAFLDHDGFQCGYCTPGQICSAVALLDEWRRGQGSVLDIAPAKAAELTRDEIGERMSGNLCRCSAYPNIVSAVQAAHGQEQNL